MASFEFVYPREVAPRVERAVIHRGMIGQNRAVTGLALHNAAFVPGDFRSKAFLYSLPGRMEAGRIKTFHHACSIHDIHPPRLRKKAPERLFVAGLHARFRGHGLPVISSMRASIATPFAIKSAPA